MEKRFWDAPEMYRQALGMNEKQNNVNSLINERQYNMNSSVRVPSCINDDYCLGTPENINNNILTMVFANMQPLDSIYPTETALKNGTLFPNLDKPFLCGGMKR